MSDCPISHSIGEQLSSEPLPGEVLSVLHETHCCHFIGSSFRLAAADLYTHHPTARIVHTTIFVTPVVEHWLEREIA